MNMFEPTTALTLAAMALTKGRRCMTPLLSTLSPHTYTCATTQPPPHRHRHQHRRRRRHRHRHRHRHRRHCHRLCRGVGPNPHPHPHPHPHSIKAAALALALALARVRVRVRVLAIRTMMLMQPSWQKRKITSRSARSASCASGRWPCTYQHFLTALVSKSLPHQATKTPSHQSVTALPPPY